MNTSLISTRNARFQQWQALLGNRTKRHRAGTFVVQGVRPITLAAEHGWEFEALLYPAGRSLSRWASERLRTTDCDQAQLSPELMRELGDKAEGTPELIAVVRMRPDELSRIPVPADFLGIVFDRPVGPGNIGTLVRSADALGAHGVVITGHAADIYDPKAVRASTGSLFGIPVVRADTPRSVVEWLAGRAQVVGTDEQGTIPLADATLTGPTLLVVGNETAGMSAAWRTGCDVVAAIPIAGSASSLNAATAGSIALYEAAQQRSSSNRG
jgi:TrmH family RNA methyltransferase